MIRKIAILLVVLLAAFCTHSMAYSSDDVEWASSIDSKVLHWGDSVTDDEYTVKVMDFSEDGFVHVLILEDDEIKEQGAIHVGGSLTYDDEIKVFAKEIKVNIDDWTGNMEDPTANLQIYRRGIPEFEITIEPEKETYDPRLISTPSKIVTSITLENIGDAKAEDIDIIIDTGGLELYGGKLKYDIMSMEKDEVSEPYTVKLDIPLMWDEKEFNVSVKVKSHDIKGNLHEDGDFELVKVEEKWGLEITKNMPEEIHMSDTVRVQVSIRNSGLTNLNSIQVSDSFNEEFELLDSVTFDKTVSLKPGEQVAGFFEYSLKPIETGEFTAPETTAEFKAANGKTYTVSSNEPEYDIEGPNIALTKSISSDNIAPNDRITVTVDVKNKGNTKVSVKASDTLPEGATFVSGDMEFHEVLEKGEKQSFSYVMKIKDAGDYKLPSATSTFVALDGYEGERISNMPIISVVLPPEDTNAVDSQTQSESSEGTSTGLGTSAGGLVEGVNNVVSYGEEGEGVAPGFGSILAGAVLLCACVFLRKKR